MTLLGYWLIRLELISGAKGNSFRILWCRGNGAGEAVLKNAGGVPSAAVYRYFDFDGVLDFVKNAAKPSDRVRLTLATPLEAGVARAK